MKEAQITAEENYSKEVGVGRFILEWAFISIVGIPLFSCLLIIIKIAMDIFFHILFNRDLNIINYVLNETFYADWDEPLFIIFIFSVLYVIMGWRLYHLVKKKPFASFTDEKLILSFERKTFLWDQIQAVHLEGRRKLTVVYKEKGKRKKEAFDLRWFPKKEDFLYSLRNICTKRNIPFYESGLTYFSRIWLRIGFGLWKGTHDEEIALQE